jgi:hypothetical protein
VDSGLVNPDEELEAPRRFPEIGQADLFRFFTLTPADVALADNLIHPGGRWYAR